MNRPRVPPWVKVVAQHAHRSFREFRYLAAFALMPVWLGAILRLIQRQDALQYLNGYLMNGEALLLCTATVGPLLFTIIVSDAKVPKGGKLFPLRELYILTIIVICVISAALLGFKTAVGTAGFISLDALWLLSAGVSMMSIVVWFAVVGTSAARESGASEIMSQDTRDFVREFGDADD